MVFFSSKTWRNGAAEIFFMEDTNVAVKLGTNNKVIRKKILVEITTSSNRCY